MNSMLTLEEVRNYLDLEQEQIEKWIKERKLHAYKIGGTYIRFRKDEILNLRAELSPQKGKVQGKVFFSKINDFWRFNNFYVLSIVLIAALIYLILQSPK